MVTLFGIPEADQPHILSTSPNPEARVSSPTRPPHSPIIPERRISIPRLIYPSAVIPEDRTEGLMSSPLPIPSSPYRFSAMTPPLATTPSPYPEYCVPQLFPLMSPRRSSPPPTPGIGCSPAHLPTTSSSATASSIQPEESFPAPSALSGAESFSSNFLTGSSACPSPQDMDESQLQEYLKRLSASELVQYLQRLSDEQLKHTIPVEFLEFFDSQPGMGLIESNVGTVPTVPAHSPPAVASTPGSSSMPTRLAPGTQSYSPGPVNPYCGEPWADIVVFPIRHAGRKGYDARVKQVRPDTQTTSWLSIFIQYENPQITLAAEWLDYHILRRRDNTRFIAHTGVHPHFRFKVGYQPNYILEDVKSAVDRKCKAEAVMGKERASKRLHLDEALVAVVGDMTSMSNTSNGSHYDANIASLLLRPPTCTGAHWIFNPDWSGRPASIACAKKSAR